MTQSVVPSSSANTGARQSSPPPSNQAFKHRNISYILRAAPLAAPYFSPELEEGFRKKMAAQILDALIVHKLDLLSLFTDDEQIKVVFKNKAQRNAACALRLYGLLLILEEVKPLDERTRQTMLRVLHAVESEFSDLINPEEIADLKEKIASS